MISDEERDLLMRRLSRAAQRAQRTRWMRGMSQPWQSAYVKFLRATSKGCEVAARTFFGASMIVVLPEHVSTSIWRYGFVEHEVCRLLISLLPPGGRFVDVGAHFGFFTLLGARLVGENGRVLAVEPTPSTYAVLRRNVAGHANVESCPRAAFSEAGPIVMYDYGIEFSAYNSAFGMRRPGQRAPKGRTEIVVQGQKVDHLLAERGWEHVDVIKIDAEASEGHVLQGLESTIRRHRPAVIIEAIDDEIEGSWASARIIRWFEDRGYAPFEVGGAQVVPYRIRQLYDHVNLLFLAGDRKG